MSVDMCIMKDYGENIKTGSFQPTLWHSSTVKVCYADIYRHESGRCHTLLPFLTCFYHFTFPGFPFLLYYNFLLFFSFPSSFRFPISYSFWVLPSSLLFRRPYNINLLHSPASIFLFLYLLDFILNKNKWINK